MHMLAHPKMQVIQQDAAALVRPEISQFVFFPELFWNRYDLSRFGNVTNCTFNRRPRVRLKAEELQRKQAEERERQEQAAQRAEMERQRQEEERRKKEEDDKRQKERRLKELQDQLDREVTHN